MSEDTPPPAPEHDYRFILRPEQSHYWRTKGLKVDLGANRWCRYIGVKLLKHIKHSIQLGLIASGGPQKPLKPETSRARKAAKGTRPKARGFTEHGIFVHSLVLRKLSASKVKASYAITTDKPEVFEDWLVDEKARGVDYFPVHGDVARLIENALDTMIRRAVKHGNVRGPQ